MATQSLTSRQDWINAAYDAVSRHGLEAVSIEGVAEQLGVSKAGFYHRFDDRQELMDAVIAQWVSHGTSLFERSARVGDPVRQLRELGCDFLTDTQFRRIDGWILLHARNHPALAEQIRGVRLESVTWARVILRRIGFDEQTAHVRAQLIYTGYLGLVADIEVLSSPPSPSDLCRRFDELVDIAIAR